MAKFKAKKVVAAKQSFKFSSCEVTSKKRIIVKKEREKEEKIIPVVNQAFGKDASQYRLECQELASKLKEKDKEMEGIKSHVELLFESRTNHK